MGEWAVACEGRSFSFSLSRRPTARSFDGLTDRMENWRENRAVGAHNRKMGCDFKEWDIGRTLTCQTRSDGSHPIINFYHCKNRIRSVGQWERKIGWDPSKHESHPITFVNTNDIKLFKIGQWDAGFTYCILEY